MQEDIGDFEGETPTVDSLVNANTSPAATMLSKRDLSKLSVDDLQKMLKSKKIQYDLTRQHFGQLQVKLSRQEKYEKNVKMSH